MKGFGESFEPTKKVPLSPEEEALLAGMPGNLEFGEGPEGAEVRFPDINEMPPLPKVEKGRDRVIGAARDEVSKTFMPGADKGKYDAALEKEIRRHIEKSN